MVASWWWYEVSRGSGIELVRNMSGDLYSKPRRMQTMSEKEGCSTVLLSQTCTAHKQAAMVIKEQFHAKKSNIGIFVKAPSKPRLDFSAHLVSSLE